nr:SDR family oxidoreductase [Microbacterium bovistercoris]
MSSNRSSLEGSVIVVTGGGQGIGRAYAHEIARAGGTPVIAEINEARAAAVVAEIEAEGGHAVSLPLDVGSQESTQRLGSDLLERFGKVDGLVNNAAIFSTIKVKPFWEISIEEWDTLLAVNLRGPWLVTTALLPALRAAGKASIVNVASDSVWLGRGGYLHYVASKAGLAGMTFAMAHELGADEIRVNTLSPGPTYTEIERETVSPEQRKAMHERQALARDAHPDDMVGTVLFLLSDASAFITGQTFHVNGGLVHF